MMTPEWKSVDKWTMRPGPPRVQQAIEKKTLTEILLPVGTGLIPK
jgi:hypothetical protein